MEYSAEKYYNFVREYLYLESFYFKQRIETLKYHAFTYTYSYG